MSEWRKHPQLAGALPAGHVAMQCTYFAKSVSRNWLVPVHQDLSIPVAERVDEPTLAGWSEKEGQLFVQAPREVLESLVAVRLHLDRCGEEDGPLQVVPGSHRDGVLSAEAAVQVRRAQGVVSCLAEQGDAVVMKPLLLHASSKATGTSQRRVLHFLFGPPSLPHGLQWLASAP
jgi:ectoine hydroxylase-related dioxygenase (phytanoyl-CoA dioxygenase family)